MDNSKNGGKIKKLAMGGPAAGNVVTGIGNSLDALGQFIPTDNDGFGDASTTIVACTIPVGYVSNNTDCDPANGAKWRTATLYIDLDGDGYTNGTAVVCYGATLPAGYKMTSLGTDCNDNNAAIRPGVAEICGNGIDDNCNGQIDEGCAVSCMFE